MKLNVTQFITAELANPHDKENWEWISSERLNTVFSSASSFYLVNLSFFPEVKVLGYYMIIGVLKENLGCPGGSDCKESACNAGDPSLIPELEDPLEKEIATHSSTLAWKIPWTEKPSGLYSPYFHKMSRHD